MQDDNIIERTVRWVTTHVSHRQLLLLLAFIVGFLAALAAYILHSLIHIIQHMLSSQFASEGFNWFYLVCPVIGILLTMLFVRYIVRDNISHGITRILYAFSTKQGRLPSHNTWTSVVASAITIGFGGSVGAEAPIVLTGSAIGSTLAQRFKLDNKTIFMLVGCGASAAIAGIFKAPIAGLVFTIEVLMIDLTMGSLLPILISCVTATCFTYVLVGDSSLFTFTLQEAWPVNRAPANIMLGIACGLVSLYFIRSMTYCEDFYARLKSHPYIRLIIGGIILSLLIFLFPSLYGEGYSAINILLNGKSEAEFATLMNRSLFSGHESLLIVYVTLVLLTKTIATSSTNGGGGCGGTFAPSLFIGAFAGFLFARIWNHYSLGIIVPENNFALLGMAGVMSGVMHAPLTGVFLIAELTGGYDLFIPLMIVSTVSYLTIYIFEPHSIYGMRLAHQGKLITHHTDHAVLTLMSLDTVIERDCSAVSPDMMLSELVHKISRSRVDVLPVTDTGNHLIGEIDMMKLRHILFRTELYHRFSVRQLMSEPPALLGVNDPMEDVMKAFDSTNAQQLPVVTTDKELIGYVSRAHVYSLYRKIVADLSTD
ncbi:MAG: chloride channel protein [Prevotella sp.]|nr:chloride channel protein [Hoylesella loescheii]MCI7561401.1 chloride channel protein [Bacteroidales bacterium]MDY3673498.1 chloride channel protein [Prevotella sp.]MDD6028526.1 chloride channel protein [Bacteroidales bacterium]MDD7105220.1 chloride channel protein [Bacteroidales bacterium]